MVKKTGTEGNCLYCSNSYSGITMMTRHLESCEKRKNFYLEMNEKIRNIPQSNNIVFLLSISSKNYPEYWMFVEIDGRSKLKAMDNFLRDTWLECCGHLSSFTIKGTRYESQLDPFPFPDPFFNENSKTMEQSTSNIFQPGMNIDYVYDYGSSTELVLKVISDIPGKIGGKNKVKLVARNNELVFKCTRCKKETATKICAVCIHEKNRNSASFCNNCVNLHRCGKEMALPIVNSPRSGECGYTG
jgi:hypothetical protein